MKKRVISVAIGLILLVSLFGVLARMNHIMLDDGVYNIYESSIMLEKGWNLVAFGEFEGGTEIKQEDIRAVFYYDPSTKNYVRAFPESKEFNELADQDFCGDWSCSAEERADYESWCYKDCQFELNDNIISNLNVIKQESFTLTKNEKKNLNFINRIYDMEVYWSNDPVEEGASPLEGDGVILYWKGINPDGSYDGTHSDGRFSNTPDDGNPYNDIGAYLIETGRWDDALPWLERATQATRYDSNFYAFYNLGRVWEHKGDWMKGLEAYRSAAELNPGYTLAEKAVLRMQSMLN